MTTETVYAFMFLFFFSSRRRHTRLQGDWSSDVCSSDLAPSWFRTRSTVVVRGTVCARGDSLRIAVGTQVGRQATDPTVITAQGETGQIGRASCRERV